MIHKNIRNLRDCVRIWFFWKKEALICAGILFLIAAIYILLAPASYTTSAKIVLLPRSTEGSVITTGSNDKVVSPVTLEDVNTEIEIILSDDVARSTINICKENNFELGLTPKAPMWIEKTKKEFSQFISKLFPDSSANDSIAEIENDVKSVLSSISAKANVASNIINLNLDCANPKAGTRLLNLYCDEYIKSHNRIFTQQRGAQFLQAQVDTLKKILSVSQDSLSNFESKYSIVDKKMQDQKNLEVLTELENQAKDIDLQSDLINSRISLLQKALEQKQSDLSITEEMRSVPFLLELDKSIVPLLLKRSDLASRYTPSSLEYLANEKQIENAYTQRKAEIEKALSAEKMELESQQVQRRSILGKIAIQKQVINELNSKSKEHEELQNQADQDLKNYLLYSSKSEDARILSAKTADNISSVNIADQADVPVEKSFPKRKIMLFIALFIAMIFCICLPYVIEVFDMRLKTAGDIETVLGIPVTGTILNIKKKTEARPDNSKELLKRLDYLSYSEKLKTFCFSSVSTGMGCTTVFELMILSLQKLNLDLRILFVDANFSSPVLHQRIGVKQSPGFFELINGTYMFDDVIAQMGSSNVYFIPTGNVDPKNPPIFSRTVIEKWLKGLSSYYDIILIDASANRDALLFSRIASCCDRTILVMASGSTHLNSTRRQIETLQKEGVKVGGAILTRYDYLIPQWLYKIL